MAMPNNPKVQSKGAKNGAYSAASKGNMSGKLSPSPVSTVVPVRELPVPKMGKMTPMPPRADGSGKVGKG